MYSYVGYGLGIHSDLLLSELVAGEAGADVIVRLDKLEGRLPEAGSLEYGFWATAEGTYLFWEDVGTILIRNGTEIVVDTFPEVEMERLRLFLLGAAIGVILHQRGMTTLHASAVSKDGRAVLFMGDKGRGKSTMAAFMCEQGYQLLSDDVVALTIDDAGQISILPAFPQLKLWPDAVESIGKDPEALPRLSSKFDKRHVETSGEFPTGPIPVAQAYALYKGDEASIEPISQQSAVFELMKNLYVARFEDELLDGEQAPIFMRCARIAKSLPMFTLTRPTSLELIPTIAKMVSYQMTGLIEAAEVLGD